METSDQARIQRGESIRVTEDRKVIDLYRDGTMIFATMADSNFLAWGHKGSVKINPLALIEVVYSFVSLYQRVLNDFRSPPESIAFRIELRNMHLDGVKNYLLPGALMSTSQQFEMDARQAPDDNWKWSKSFHSAEFDVAAISYDLVREVYLWFGHEESAIPYSKEVNGIKMISPDAIAKNG